MTHYLLTTLCVIVIRILMQNAASGKIKETHGSARMNGASTGIRAAGNILAQSVGDELN